ncbi:M20 metallopeptidase family protein [Dethiothermospora halolimnae]|uniref:M20 metallopeptidase family protein n=1 Tax=Dethiothermospora halolimnae TaxID=3114390 RepID=UPI003CCC26EE
MEDLLTNISNEVIKIRRKLHQIPEIGFKEFKTSRYIKEKLKEYGYEIEEVAKTGIIAIKKGKSNKKAIAFRADMDGLMVNEKTNVIYSSIHEGKMHACGHDGHMAILLGLALYLSKINNIDRDIVLIFQPAEEGPGGAKVIVDEGYLDKYNIGAIFGLHTYPGIEEGKIGVKRGPLMAQNGEINIEIKAKSSHGAIPHKGIDGIVIASQLVQSYQSIISRNIDPLEGAVLTIGKIKGGEARNVIASNIKLEGTMRAFNPEVYNLVKERILDINKGMEKAFNCKIETDIIDFYPPVINDDNLYTTVINALGTEEIINIDPMMISEDFSYYQQAIPGFFMMLGSRNISKGLIHPLHSCYFDFNEGILIEGVKAYIKICEELEVI